MSGWWKIEWQSTCWILQLEEAKNRLKFSQYPHWGLKIFWKMSKSINSAHLNYWLFLRAIPKKWIQFFSNSFCVNWNALYPINYIQLSRCRIYKKWKCIKFHWKNIFELVQFRLLLKGGESWKNWVIFLNPTFLRKYSKFVFLFQKSL